MEPTPHRLAALYSRAHDSMRAVDGLQPGEAFDELLKYLFLKENAEASSLRESIRGRTSRNGRPPDKARDVAVRLRAQYLQFVRASRFAAVSQWLGQGLQLSDAALTAVHEALSAVSLRGVGFDVRSAALREFLSPEARRGLGIYLTPDSVVRTMVEVAAPRVGSTVYDPACGSGTFPIEVLRFWAHGKSRAVGSKRHRVFGSDKSARMLLIADLNLAHQAGAEFGGFLHDTLAPLDRFPLAAPIAPGSIDSIFTNPPFGVVVDQTSFDLEGYESCLRSSSGEIARQQGEILFLEQCLKLLRPGGELAIVLPRSVITNARLATARSVLGRVGYVYAAIALPSETFASTGTQTTTWAIFMRKYDRRDRPSDMTRIAFADVKNVGFDATGRPRGGSELDSLSADIRNALKHKRDFGIVRLLPPLSKSDTLSEIATRTGGSTRSVSGSVALAELVDSVTTGRTPARSAYSDEGVFLVKVGNLTGHGINWEPRDRNFVRAESLTARTIEALTLRCGDILLTSSAHTPKYIGKKVDIVTEIPPSIGGRAFFVGEVMRIRPRPDGIDPFVLLAFLRSAEATEFMQSRIRGQTAHLMPDDMLGLRVPRAFLEASQTTTRISAILKRESQLSLAIQGLRLESAELMGQALARDSG